MAGFLLFFFNQLQLQNLIIYTAVLFIGCSFVFFAYLLIKWRKKINEQKLRENYDGVIDTVFHEAIFEETPLHTILATEQYKVIFKEKKFRNMLVQNIIKLHFNYTGTAKQKLEELYRESGLLHFSYSKLRSRNWKKKCEGIRELSRMNIKDSFYDIYMCMWHSNDTLKLESLIGLLRLEGIDGLAIIKDYPNPINDWIQINLLYEIDNANLTVFTNFSELLHSKNESVVDLGLRLSAKFNQIAALNDLPDSSISKKRLSRFTESLY